MLFDVVTICWIVGWYYQYCPVTHVTPWTAREYQDSLSHLITLQSHTASQLPHQTPSYLKAEVYAVGS